MGGNLASEIDQLYRPPFHSRMATIGARQEQQAVDESRQAIGLLEMLPITPR